MSDVSRQGARRVRVARAIAASALAVFTAVSAHLIGGGSTPSPLILAAAVVLGIPLATALIGPRLSLWRSAAAVLVSQGLFHVFAAFAGSGMAMPQHAHHLAPAGPTAIVSGGLADSAGAHAHIWPTGPMALTHLAAAAVTLVVLRWGEQVLADLAALASWGAQVVAALSSLVLSPVTRPRGPAAPSRSESDLAEQLLSWARLRHRGPPTAFAV